MFPIKGLEPALPEIPNPQRNLNREFLITFFKLWDLEDLLVTVYFNGCAIDGASEISKWELHYKNVCFVPGTRSDTYPHIRWEWEILLN